MVSGAALLILALLAAYVGATRNVQEEPELLDWQISAFYELERADQAIYNVGFRVVCEDRAATR